MIFIANQPLTFLNLLMMFPEKQQIFCGHFFCQERCLELMKLSIYVILNMIRINQIVMMKIIMMIIVKY